ncbi:MAG: prolyl oligopeptidase family serine peptidase, partial [Geminicoccaceae bacterium]
MMPTSGRPTLETPDDDPRLWLEAIDDEKALQWVERQNGITLDRYGDASYQHDCNVLTDIFDRPDHIPFIRRRGGLLYNFWTDAEQPRGTWRRTTLDDYRRKAPDWHTLLDLDDLASRENEDWIWQGASSLLPDHERAIVRLSRGGSDAVVLREFDLTTRSWVEDGFYLPEAKGGIAWLDRETLLLSSAIGEGMATTSGYSRTVRLWRRGEDVEHAPVLFETETDNLRSWALVDRTAGREDIWFGDWPGFFEQRWWIGDRSGPKTRIDLPADAGFQVRSDWLVVRPRSRWTVGGKNHAPDSVLGISFPAFLEGDRDFHVLFEASERCTLDGFFWAGPTLVLSILDNLAPVFEFRSPSKQGWERTEQPDLPEIAAANLWPLDVEPEEANDDLIGTVQTPITPPTFTLFLSNKAPEILKRAPATFDSQGLHVSRHEAISIDGERIPYVQVGPEEPSGNEPVHLSGYGGFRSSQRPYYRASIGKLWLERGGT